ncbi:MAG: hypothetical protein ABFE13_21995 [Phycisphaerales bacterium]
MRFFTWKLWEQVNSNSDAVSTRADDAWMRNHKAYDAQLRPLLARFSKRNRRFWSGDAVDLHDGQVVRVTIGDAVNADVFADWPKSWRTCAEIEVADRGARMHCVLRYGQVEAVDARLREGGWSYGGTVFDTWGYHELTAEGADTFRHSILFATGGELSIVFKRFSYVHRRLANPR